MPEPPGGGEIPGVSPLPPPPPPAPSPSPSPNESATAVLNEAVVLETTEIETNPPPDADARLEFLHSLPPTFSSEEVSSLMSYEWVSTDAETKFNEALALIADG